MSIVFEAITFGVIVAFIVVGIIGTAVPIIPGTLLIWMGTAVYAWHVGFDTFGLTYFLLLSLIAIVTGTADLWLPLISSKAGGASGRAILFGTIGAIVGTFVLPIPIVGTIVGYIGGLLLGEYQKHGDWELAKKAGLRGLAGWGLATAVQFGGGILMLLIFVIRVLTL
ncbi:MAG: DUF456 domain-containing protein [Ardenticatenaceae bacterium]|nr:DUF456 domain-containing protein [Anaerolineales bacterium]MCB8921079.1 DUF456 domain-containing protein [Ardenticatenaceae bacterium]MCB9005366.1 DUF456 domain-containing protein [Ardenticatenaceae bacterium]